MELIAGVIQRIWALAVDFVRDVQPIFEAKCLKCHGAEKQKSGYRLDVKQVDARAFGSTNPKKSKEASRRVEIVVATR